MHYRFYDKSCNHYVRLIARKYLRQIYENEYNRTFYGPSIFCQNYQKFCFEQQAGNSSLIEGISEVFSKFTKFPVAIVSGGGDKAFLWISISHDHMINESRDSVVRYPHPKLQRLYSKCNRTL